jgi:integrase/recombinase XerD
MPKKKVKIDSNISLETDIQNDRHKKNLFNLEKFFISHDMFMQDKALEGLAPRTLKEYTVNLNYFKKYLEEAYQSGYNCIAVNGEIFKGYLYYMIHEKKYSPFTVNIRIRTIKAYLRWLYNEKYTEDNYALKFKLVKTPIDAVQPLSDEDIKKMLEACDRSTYNGFRNYCLIFLILDCGIRIGEACELKIEDIDLKQGLIRVRAEVAKTRNFRQLPVSSYTAKLLKDLIDIADANECEYVFMSTYGGKIKKENLILSFRRLGEKVGLKQRCTPYVFRHTFATNAVKSGKMDLFTIQRIMGHSTLVTTRRYVQLESKDLIKKHSSASLIDKFIKGGRK